MDFIIEIIMEIVIEIFGEGYVALSTAFMPNKPLSKRAHDVLKFVFSFIGAVFFILMIIGIIILIENKGSSTLGWIFVGISAVYTIISVALKVFANKRSR